MKKKNQTSHNDNPGKGAETFFDQNSPEIQTGEDTKSNKEQDSLFGEQQYTGGFKDIDVWIKHEEFRLKHERFKIEKSDRESERKLRESNAKIAFKFSATWAVFIAVFIILKGFGAKIAFNFSETEFLFVVGSLTSSILLFYTLVIRYLFQRPEQESSDS